MKLSYMLTAASALVVALSTVPATAATVVQNLTLTGNFTPNASTPAIGSVVFSLNFDNTTSFSSNLGGVSLVSTNLSGPLKIAYDAKQDKLTLMGGNGNVLPGTCFFASETFCSFISNISTSPSTNSFQYFDGSNLNFATNVTLVTTGSAVPETATWAMMLAGFGMIGFAARRRSNVKTTVAYA